MDIYICEVRTEPHTNNVCELAESLTNYKYWANTEDLFHLGLEAAERKACQGCANVRKSNKRDSR